MSTWIQYVPPVIAAFVILGIFAWRMFKYSHELRLKLLDITNLEKVLDDLSVEFDEANTRIFNRSVGSETDYGMWRSDWIAWQKKIETFLEKKLGLRERNVFRNLVLFEEFKIAGSFPNSDHNRERCMVAHQLERIREIIIRYSERAAKWRVEKNEA